MTSKTDIFSQLDKFFNPDSVAVVGASAEPGKIGHEILRSLLECGYTGRVYPVTLRSGEILGRKCFQKITDIPDKVDLAVLAVASQHTPQVLEQCGEKGVRNVVVVAGGFKEAGGEYSELEARIVSIARKYGIRVIGPNCIGVFNGRNRLDTFFQSRERMVRPPNGPLSMLTQSGTFGATFLEWAAESGLGVSKMVSYGNKSDVDEADLLTYLDADPDTRVIAMYIEAVGDGRRLVDAARRVASRKPIVVMKAGRTRLGVQAALSHTGGLAGSYEVNMSAFRQAGMITVRDFEELFDVCKALALLPLPNGRRVGMVTNGAGPAVMASDDFHELGVDVGRYSESTIEYLKRTLPPYALPRMVIDLTGSATSQDYRVSMEALLRDPNVDLLMPFFVFQDTPLGDDIVDVVADMLRFGKPIIACAAGGPYSSKQSASLEARGVPVYPTAERAVRAAHALFTYMEVKRRLASTVTWSAAQTSSGSRAAAGTVARALSEGRRTLLEHEAKEILRGYGVKTPVERLAKSEEEAVRLAKDIGFPVVLKIVSPDVVHKTEVGGVRLNIRSAEDVRQAYREIVANLREKAPQAAFEGVLVQEMVGDGVEVIVGGLRDPEYGPITMFGIGGIFVEVVKDVAFRLAPTSVDEALTMITEIKGYPILRGVRGLPQANIGEIADVISNVSRIMVEHEDIVELDLNPVAVNDRRAVALDARVVLKSR